MPLACADCRLSLPFKLFFSEEEKYLQVTIFYGLVRWSELKIGLM